MIARPISAPISRPRTPKWAPLLVALLVAVRDPSRISGESTARPTRVPTTNEDTALQKPRPSVIDSQPNSITPSDRLLPTTIATKLPTVAVLSASGMRSTPIASISSGRSSVPR
jgi:hypothetical protein